MPEWQTSTERALAHKYRSPDTLTDREVSQSHLIADLLAQIAAYRRAATAASQLLRDAQHAHEHGRTFVVAEFLERAIAHIEPAVIH